MEHFLLVRTFCQFLSSWSGVEKAKMAPDEMERWNIRAIVLFLLERDGAADKKKALTEVLSAMVLSVGVARTFPKTAGRKKTLCCIGGAQCPILETVQCFSV
jgi:hypothetical protein